MILSHDICLIPHPILTMGNLIPIQERILLDFSILTLLLNNLKLERAFLVLSFSPAKIKIRSPDEALHVSA